MTCIDKRFGFQKFKYGSYMAKLFYHGGHNDFNHVLCLALYRAQRSKIQCFIMVQK